MKKVSIIVPAYNASKTIDAALTCLKNQTYKNFEVLAVDDGSTDSTLSILQYWQEQDDRFKAIHIEHGGVSRARNTGIANATGDYIQFMDADDTLSEHMLEKMVSLLEKNDADLCVCRYTNSILKCFYEDKVYDLTNKDDLYSFYQDCFGLVMPWNKLWKRECFKTSYDESVHISEDELCNFSNLPNVKKVVSTSEYLYFYVLNMMRPKEEQKNEDATIDKLFKGNFWENKTSMCHQLLSYMPQHEAVVDRAIKDNLWPKELAEELKYLRVIDYAFWQLVPFVASGVPKFGLIVEYTSIFNCKEFVSYFNSQKKYGFKLKKITTQQQAELIEKFIDFCIEAFQKNADNRDITFAFVFMSIFLKLFTEKCGTLNLVSNQARLIDELDHNSTIEAQCANSVLKQFGF
ncbi:MAG: glycosyltransferase family 2 protein [Clostridia bacterium]|nr:glycosyltransferase family 2 protein [Clostridia bacterium]